MSTLQEQARALGDVTRHDIFRFVADAERPVEVAELTEHFGLNHNAIRQHLAKLVAAELLTEDLAPARGPGRPRLRYIPHPTAESRWGVMGPYQRLALWMAEVIKSGDSPVDVGRRVGRRQRLGTVGTDDPVGYLVDQMARHGFEPVVEQRGGEVDIRLCRCPFTSTALADPDTVCQLHLGIAQGVADRVEDLVVDGLVVRDPREGNCRLRCHVGPPPADTSAAVRTRRRSPSAKTSGNIPRSNRKTRSGS